MVDRCVPYYFDDDDGWIFETAADGPCVLIEDHEQALATERERADQLENNITDDEEDLRWLRDELQERLGLPNADDDALLAAVSALRANTAEAVTVLKSRDDLDGWPGIVEAAIVILEPLSGGEFQKWAALEAERDAAIERAEANYLKTRYAGSAVIDALVLPGHSLRDAWLDLLVMCGRYCKPYLDWSPEARAEAAEAEVERLRTNEDVAWQHAAGAAGRVNLLEDRIAKALSTLKGSKCTTGLELWDVVKEAIAALKGES